MKYRVIRDGMQVAEERPDSFTPNDAPQPPTIELGYRRETADAIASTVE